MTTQREINRLANHFSQLTINERIKPPAIINSGGLYKSSGSETGQRATVIVPPSPPNPDADEGTAAYAGSGEYIVRPINLNYGNWEADHDPPYALNAQVIDPYDNRVYTMINTEGISDPDLAPHENPTDWELYDEIKIEHVEGFDIEGSEINIKDCVPVFPVGSIVRITSRKLADDSTRYYLEHTLTKAGSSLAWVNGELIAVYPEQ